MPDPLTDLLLGQFMVLVNKGRRPRGPNAQPILLPSWSIHLTQNDPFLTARRGGYWRPLARPDAARARPSQMSLQCHLRRAKSGDLFIKCNKPIFWASQTIANLHYGEGLISGVNNFCFATKGFLCYVQNLP